MRPNDADQKNYWDRGSSMQSTTQMKIIVPFLASLAMGCGNKNLFQNDGETSRRSRSNGEQNPGQESTGTGPSKNSPGVSPSTPPSNPGATLAPSPQLEEWCAKAGQTNAIKGKLADRFKLLCDGGKPTELLRETLVKRAYSGGDAIQFVDIEPLKSDRSTRTTSHTFGVGIKIPVPIKVHFDTVAPKASSVAEMKSLAEMDGATADIKIEQEHTQDGPFHTSGKTVFSKITEDYFIVQIDMQSRDRLDQYALKDGEQYMYTRYVDEVIKGVLRFDMVTAGLKIGADSYLLSVVSYKIDNLGQSGAAENKLKDLAANTVKRMFKLAEDAASVP